VPVPVRWYGRSQRYVTADLLDCSGAGQSENWKASDPRPLTVLATAEGM
jgi:hypothetical protein